MSFLSRSVLFTAMSLIQEAGLLVILIIINLCFVVAIVTSICVFCGKI